MKKQKYASIQQGCAVAKKDQGLNSGSVQGVERKVRSWTIDELVEIAKTAIDNAADQAMADIPPNFDAELDFQLSAPEHCDRRPLTSVQIAVIRAIWNADERTSSPDPVPQPEFKEQGFPWR